MDKTYAITLESKYQKGLIIVAQDYKNEWYHNGKRLVKSSYRVRESEREKEEAEQVWNDGSNAGMGWCAVVLMILGGIAYFLGQA